MPAAAQKRRDAASPKEGFTPPNFLAAMKQAGPFRRGGISGSAGSIPRPSAAAGGSRWSRWKEAQTRAQPATGTEEDRIRVTYLEKREIVIGWALSGFMVLSTLVLFFQYIHYTNKKNAHLAVDYHHAAPFILIVGLVLAGLQVAGTLTKRRALLGFALLLSGFALFSASAVFGLVYLVVGGWMIFRALRRPRPAVAGAGATPTPTAPAGRTSTAARDGTKRAAPAAKPRSAPAASKRYTPPKPQPKNGSRPNRPASGLPPDAEAVSGGRLRRLRRRQSSS